MQISDLTNQYTNTTSQTESMSGTRGVEQLVSTVRNLTAGNIFEGTVNSIKGNQVMLGLSNGTQLAARIEANMQLVQGQSMFFQVKSNNGETIAIRPYTVDGNGANLTLLNALKAANLPVQDKYLTMANTMMQEQMPIDKNSMAQMARVLMANPDMNVQTLVQMKKLNIPITTEMVAQFENYMDDRSAVHTALDKFIGELPATLSSKNMPLEQMKAFDSQLLFILADGTEPSANAGQPADVGQSVTAGQSTSVGQTADIGQPAETGRPVSIGQSADASQPVNAGQLADASQSAGAGQLANAGQLTDAGQLASVGQSADPGQSASLGQPTTEGMLTPEGMKVAEGQSGTIGATVSENQQMVSVSNVSPENANSHQVTKLITDLFGDIGITREDSAETLLQKLAAHIATGKNVTKEALNYLFSSKDMQNLLKDVIEKQMYLEPKDVADSEKLKKLYDRLDAKTQNIESLLQNAGLKDTPLAQTIGELHANVEFMNQLNEAYTYTQIPLRMTNQNASGQLYVYTSKRNLDDPERDLTAFLHLDLEHLGATDVSVRMHKKEVSTKFYMDSDASYELVKMYMPQLEERLRAKGYNCKIEVENEGQHVNFVEDFLKKDAPSTGQLHRYSFDVRA